MSKPKLFWQFNVGDGGRCLQKSCGILVNWMAFLGDTAPRLPSETVFLPRFVSFEFAMADR